MPIETKINPNFIMYKEWVYTLEQIDDVSREILALMPADSKIFLTGEMGAGKTTFCKSFISQMGVNDEVSSPTYAIVNDYEIPGSNRKVYHMDLYRLKNIEEALDIGIEDYLYDDSFCLIEWPEIINNLANEKTYRLNIVNLSDNRRKLVFL